MRSSAECCVETSCSLSLSHLKHVCRLLEICNTGPGDCTAASVEPGTNMFWTVCGSHWASSGSSAHVFASVHPSRCSDHPVQGMEPVVLPQFFCNVCVRRYSGIASLLARQRSCTAVVKHQCSASLSGCTAPVATSTVFASCGHGRVEKLHMMERVSLNAESGES